MRSTKFFVIHLHSLSRQMLVKRNQFWIFTGWIFYATTEMRQIRVQWWIILRFARVRIITRQSTLILNRIYSLIGGNIACRCGKVNAGSNHHLESDLSKEYPECCPAAVPNWDLYEFWNKLINELYSRLDSYIILLFHFKCVIPRIYCNYVTSKAYSPPHPKRILPDDGGAGEYNVQTMAMQMQKKVPRKWSEND